MLTHPDGDRPSPLRPRRRTRYPDLSPQSTFSRTSPPTIARDLSLWDSWANTPVEQLELDLFDESGRPIAHRLGGGGS